MNDAEFQAIIDANEESLSEEEVKEEVSKIEKKEKPKKKKKAKIDPFNFMELLLGWLLGERSLKCGLIRPDIRFARKGDIVTLCLVVDYDWLIYKTITEHEIHQIIRVTAQAEIDALNDPEHVSHQFLEPTRNRLNELVAKMYARVEKGDIAHREHMWIDTKLCDIRYKNMTDKPWTKIRIPYLISNQMWTEAQQNRDNLNDVDNSLSPFLRSLKTHMQDYDLETNSSVMWEMLCCYIARIIFEQKSSRELVYWYGEGGDGKSKLFEWLQGKLPGISLTMRYDEAVNPFASGLFEDKRLLVMEEAPPGNFLTNTIKTLAGAEEIQSMRKGKDSRQITNHLCLVILSNFTPACKNEGSYLDRLRYIASRPRVDKSQNMTPEEIFEQLNDDWPIFLSRCFWTYYSHEMRIPSNAADDIKELTSATLAELEEWVFEYLEYAPGSMVSINYIVEAIASERRGRRYSAVDVKKTILAVLQPKVADIDKLIEHKRKRWQDDNKKTVMTNVQFRINKGHDNKAGIAYKLMPKE